MFGFTFTLSIFLYIYGAFLLVWLLFSLIAIYHILKFGFRGFLSIFAITVYIAGSFILLSGTFFFVSGIDWGRQVGLEDFMAIEKGISGNK